MEREERTDCNWARIIVLLTVLWAAVALPSWAQQTAHVTLWRSDHHREGAAPEAGGLRPLAEVLRSSRPDPALDGLLSALPGSEHLASGTSRRPRIRELFGLAAHAEGLLGDLRDADGSRRGLLGVARSALHALDAPGRVLSHLTGADSAAFNPFRKRISFTWYVDLP
jgi:hypothetical protein